MVNTRSTLRRGQVKDEDIPAPEAKCEEQALLQQGEEEGAAVKNSTEKKAVSSRGSRSSASSVLAQKRRLELEAAKAKARIKMELLDKQLAADLAEIDENYSPHASELDSQKDGKDIEEWLEHSQHELEKRRKQEADQGKSTGPLLPPQSSPDDGTNGPVQQLVCALKELVATTATTNQSTNLLSRISTPRELPLYFGDPMDWLSFKNAYEESSSICKFSEKENLSRLRKCLRGPAKEAVSALLISSTSPETVMSTLELLFGNPDVIISRILHDVKKLPSLPQEYQKDIVPFSVKIKNFVASVRALKREEYLQGVGVVNIVLTKLPTVLLSKWGDYSYPLVTQGEKSRLDILADFLNLEAIKTSTCSANLINLRWDNKRLYTSENKNKSETVLIQTEIGKQSDYKCYFCNGFKHKLTDCKKFKKSLRKDRWAYVKRVGVCCKCLVSRHDRQTCPAGPCEVNGCGQPHHRLLHYIPSVRQDNSVVVQPQPTVTTSTETETSAHSESVTHINTDNGTVLLKVVPVNIHGPNGIISTSALLDDGSTVSMMSASLAARAGLSGCRQTMRVRGAWDNTELLCDIELLNITLSNKLNSEKHNIRVRSVKELNLPKQNLTLVNCENYKFLHELKDNVCTERQFKPEILIGQDNYKLILPLEIIMGGPNEPCATRTPLGWCLHGRVPRASSSALVHHSSLFITEDTSFASDDDCDLHEEVRRYFSFESMGVSAYKPRQNSEDQRAWNLLEQTATLNHGRWHVGLPWKNNNSTMPDSLPTAMARLRGVELKMKKNAAYAQKYHERVQHLLVNDYCEKVVQEASTTKVWYLPHFGVENPNKRKLRLVFDAAAKTNGLCLKDYLLKGPDLLKSLFGIMLRFREQKVAVTADIKDMFLRVKIRQEDRNAFRFLFRGDPTTSLNTNVSEEQLQTYVMTSLIFGANCSPFIAQFVKNKNAQRFASTKPTAVTAIHTQHYMDDYIDSLPDEHTAIHLIKDIISIHKAGNFELRNWNSNSQEVLDSLPKESLGDAAVRFKLGEQYDGDRTLGIIWHTIDDTLRFDVSFKRVPVEIVSGNKRPTKREMLRVVMSIFDVYGFLSPFTINGKIILQETWCTNIGWDDPVNNTIYNKWLKWVYLLQSVRNIRLPRYYPMATTRVSETEGHTNPFTPPHYAHTLTDVKDGPTAVALNYSATSGATPHAPSNNNITDIASSYRCLQMHIFCDASTAAYCAVAYWRWRDSDWNIRVAFIASKCRVAGTKPVTVPRLELQAAVLAARLADTITKEHNMKAEQRFFWSDSTTVLHWIRNDARNYKIFVANRLGEIDELSQIKEWRYVPTNINIADIATRESYDCSVLQNEWLNGPTFLYKNCHEWPRDVIEPENIESQLECLTVTHRMEHENLPVPEPTRFSSWLRLLRSTAQVLTFIDRGLQALNRLNKCTSLTCAIDGDVMERAEHLLLRYSQAQSFGEEIEYLKKSKGIPTASKLLTLSPYLDDYGVLRAGGRIDATTDVSPTSKRPAILDGHDYVTRLIVRHYHIEAAHGNQETVVNELRQKYWIIRLRPTVKNVVTKCMLCRLRRCRPEVPRIGDLPEGRLAHHRRPFTHCGLDLFGPMEVTVGRRHERRYGVLFTCLTVRAIHIETVSTLTTDSLIMALRRMAARRGWPHHLYSDNGTNLRGAHAELKKSLKELDEDTLRNEAMNRGTAWTFIPPASPHWGGAWERLIRSVKTSLRVVLRERAPREEVLNTLLAEVENIVNSRPLTHVSVEPTSSETLTPNHFLIGTSSNSVQVGKFNEQDMYLSKQWRISQCLADMFWKRWVKEVLPDLLPRKKWSEERRNLEVGDLVFVVDPDGPRNMWPRGIIKEVCPGKDGRVRMVKIQTKSGVLTRSAPRVARIPMTAECC